MLLKKLKLLISDLIAGLLALLLPKKIILDGRYIPLWEKHGFQIIPANFYSPVPLRDELPPKLWETDSKLRGIDMRENEQLALLSEISSAFSAQYNTFDSLKNPGDETGYYLGNGQFDSVDAEMFYAMIRLLKPTEIIEVGSGFSTLAAFEAIKANILKDGHSTSFTAIEPYPRDFLKNSAHDFFTLREEKIQQTGPEVFAALKENDFLFIDSSHILKTGSDVWFEFCEVLPQLQKGVYVHFHDIFLPAEYLREWLLRGTYFNEQYLLQAFLCFNNTFEVLWSSSHMHIHHPDKLRKAFKSYDGSSQHWPSSIWLKKVK